MTDKPGDVTRLLRELNQHNPHAADELFPLIYSELKRLAASCIRRERPGHTLAATALVHEAYLRLMEQRNVQWNDRGHFFAVAATLMQRVVLDYARKHHAAKRGAAPQDKLSMKHCRLPSSILRLSSSRRVSHASGGIRSATGVPGGTALLRRHERGGNRRGDGHFHRDGEARVEFR